MKKFTLTAAFAAAALSLQAHAAPFPPKATLTAFASEAELTALFKGWAEEHKRRMEEQRKREDLRRQTLGAASQAAPSSAPAVAHAELSASSLAKEASSDSITNVQHAGVDEGGIVKRHGDYLVVLRRGRLFTVSIRDRELKPIAWIDAYGPRIDPRGAWYDEMLVHGDTIVVIGYSYARGGTEIGLFEITPDGGFLHKSTHHLRSNDYYSSRNYASRLIGGKLVFYTPLQLNPFSPDPGAAFPALRRWREGAAASEFKRIAPATRVYRTDDPIDPYQGVALHTVTVCDLEAKEFSCEASAVLGAPGRVFYVSPGSVYVWTTPWRRGPASESPAAVFRMPLDGGAPSALKTAGSPIDQFSFHEGGDGFLNVLVRSNGRGDGMWAAESTAGELALLRVALAEFSDGRASAPSERYVPLPRPTGGHALQNRFIGAYLLYGAGAGWRRPGAATASRVYAIDYAGGGTVYGLPLAHGVDRIESMGGGSVVVGSDGKDLHFTSLRLDRHPATVHRYVRPDAAQGETRSHGFFFKAESADDGLLGLPIIGAGQGAGRQLRQPAASLLFLRSQSLALTELGALASRPGESGRSDGCRASCVDWYGNSRPLFLGNRVFALLGYEIVEGRVHAGRIGETRRITFAPASGDYAG